MLTLVDFSATPHRKLSSYHILLIIFPAYCTFKIPLWYFLGYIESIKAQTLKISLLTITLYIFIHLNLYHLWSQDRRHSCYIMILTTTYSRASFCLCSSQFISQKVAPTSPWPPHIHPPTSFPNSAELLHYPPLAGVSLQAGPALPPMTGKPGSDRLVQVSGTARTDGRGQRRTNNKGALLFSSSGWLGSPVLHEQDKPPPHQHHQHHLPSSLRTPASRAMWPPQAGDLR